MSTEKINTITCRMLGVAEQETIAGLKAQIVEAIIPDVLRIQRRARKDPMAVEEMVDVLVGKLLKMQERALVDAKKAQIAMADLQDTREQLMKQTSEEQGEG
jgi:hypothetical protein